MTPPSDSPAVVILDVMNLRGNIGSDDDPPFTIRSFDEQIETIRQLLPAAVLICVCDGTAANENWSETFATISDQDELLRRTHLDRKNPKFIYLLPPPAANKKWDRLYLSADPVCVRLLREFELHCVLITRDRMVKDEDLLFLPKNDPLRELFFMPWWNNSKGAWVFVSRKQYYSTPKLLRKSRTRARLIRHVEDHFPAASTESPLNDKVRERAYGCVYDHVNEYRAKAKSGIRVFGDQSRSKSPFDVLKKLKFRDAGAESAESQDNVENVAFSDDSDVRVRVATEEIDLVRSIDELNVHLGKRVLVHAMLSFVNEFPYLVWFGRTSRIRVWMERPSDLLTSGFVRIQGLLSMDGGEFVITVDSKQDVTSESIGNAVKGRITRLVKRDSFVGGVEWAFPSLPPRQARQIPPPPNVVAEAEPRGDDDSKIGEALVSSGTNKATQEHGDIHEEKVNDQIPEEGIENLVENHSTRRNTWPEPSTEILTPNTRPRKRWIAAAVATLVVALVLIYALRTDVFAFEVPEPEVCKDLKFAVCQAIVIEWQGDALRVNLYGTRGPDGSIR